MMPRIPLLDLVRQHKKLRKAIDVRWDRLFEKGEFILGQEVQEFEEKMSRYLSARHAIGCASGTDALRLALGALGIGPGDEVITTAFSFFATAGAILQAGALPSFVDIGEDSYNMDPSLIAGKIGSRTKAILPVHLYGLPADMNAIRKIAKAHGLKVIEDAAQAVGAAIRGHKTGTLGDIGCFSFYPTKNLGALGDGGMVCTQDDVLAEKMRRLRVHGSKIKYVHEYVGFNSRLDSLQAAVLNAKLAHLDDWNAARRKISSYYLAELKDLPLRLPVCPKGVDHVYHLFVVACDRRDELAAFLSQRGIGSAVYYPLTLPLQPCLAFLLHRPGGFPVAEKATREILAIPNFPEMTMAQAGRVVKAIRDFFCQ